MIARLYRPLVMAFLPAALIACMNSPPTSAEPSAAVPLGIDLGGSGPVIASAQPALAAHAIHAEAQTASPRHSDMQMAHAGHNDAHGTGTVNSVDPAQHKVNLSHNPIPEIGWPTMTMEFPVAPFDRSHGDQARHAREFYDRAGSGRHVWCEPVTRIARSRSPGRSRQGRCRAAPPYPVRRRSAGNSCRR